MFPWSAIIGPLGTLLDDALKSFFPDPIARQAKINEMLVTLSQQDLGQIDLDKTEAASSSLFVAGWRPAIGWLCTVALFYQYLLVPLVMWAGFWIGHPIPKPPVLDDTLWQLTTAMLGIAGLRTFEKVQGVTR